MSKNKKFKEKYAVVPIHPLMPREYNAKRRKELKEWEKEIMEHKTIENSGREPGE